MRRTITNCHYCGEWVIAALPDCPVCEREKQLDEAQAKQQRAESANRTLRRLCLVAAKKWRECGKALTASRDERDEARDFAIKAIALLDRCILVQEYSVFIDGENLIERACDFPWLVDGVKATRKD